MKYLVISIVVATFIIVGSIDRPKYDSVQRLDWRTLTVAKFFIKKGVDDPVNKAVIVVKESRYPKIAAAQAVVESRVNPKAIGKKKERGAYQVIEKHWGKVSDRFEMQTRQHSDILNDLLQETGDVKTAITRYNGKGKLARDYCAMVVRNMNEVGL